MTKTYDIFGYFKASCLTGGRFNVKIVIDITHRNGDKFERCYYVATLGM